MRQSYLYSNVSFLLKDISSQRWVSDDGRQAEEPGVRRVQEGHRGEVHRINVIALVVEKHVVLSNTVVITDARRCEYLG